MIIFMRPFKFLCLADMLSIFLKGVFNILFKKHFLLVQKGSSGSRSDISLIDFWSVGVATPYKIPFGFLYIP